MNKGKIAGVSVGIFAAVGAGVYFYNKLKSKVDSTKSISVRVSEVKDLRFEGKGIGGAITCKCDVLVKNPSKIDLQIGVRSIALKMDGSEIASTAPSNEIVSIKSGEAKNITNVKFELPIQNLPNFDWKSLLSFDVQSIKNKLSLFIYLTVNGIDVQFDQQFGEETNQTVEPETVSGILALSAGPRTVVDGRMYNSLIEKTDGKKLTVLRNSNVRDVVRQMIKNVDQYHGQLSKLAKLLKGRNRKESCTNIFNFSYKYLQYRNDRFGVEELRTPARSWYDGQIKHKQQGVDSSGIDCDDFSVWCASLLTCLGITDWKFRITKYNGKTNWQHVYVVVPDGNDEIIIDPVLDKNNFEKQYSEKMDFSNNANRAVTGLSIQILSGLDGSSAIEKMLALDENESIDGLGDAQANDSLLKRIVLLRQSAIENPEIFKAQYPNPKIFINIADYVIRNWKINPEAALQKAAELEDQAIANGQVNGIEFEHELEEEDVRDAILLGGDIRRTNTLDPALEAVLDQSLTGIVETNRGIAAICTDVAGIAGTGSQYILVEESLDGRKERRARRKARRAKRKARRKKRGGIFKRMGKAIKKGVKSAIHVLKKLNPAAATIRQFFLLQLRSNYGGISSKLKYAYMSKEEAAKELSDPNQWQNLRDEADRLENKQIKWGGNRNAVKKAIMAGAKRRALGTLSGEDNLGVAPAIVAAAMSVIKMVVQKIKKIKLKKEQAKQAAQVAQEAQEAEEAEVARKIKGSREQSFSASAPDNSGGLSIKAKLAKALKNKKLIGFVGGSLFIGGVAIYFVAKKKKQEIEQNDKPIPKRLSGTKLT